MFAIETKTRSKLTERDSVIYDGSRILVNGHTPDRDPISQIERSARELKRMFSKFKEFNQEVQPVVLFPGWYVEKQPKDVKTWVLNDTAFVMWMKQNRQRISPELQELLVAELDDYVRRRDLLEAR